MLMRGHALIEGMASGTLLKLTEPLSLWGGVDLQTGHIVDASHPQRGAVVADRLLAMPGSRGSSSSSSALVELARAGMAPAGVITTRSDPILTIGALVADYLYGAAIPILIVSNEGFGKLSDGTNGHLWCKSDEALLTFIDQEPVQFMRHCP